MGTSLDKAKKQLSKEQRDHAAFLSINEVDKLHEGKLSTKSNKYIHADIKLPNLVLNSQGQVKLS